MKVKVRFSPESLSKGAPSFKYKPNAPMNKRKIMGKIGKEEFLKLNKQQQKKYLKAYPNSSHRFLIEGVEKKKHPVVKKKAFGKPKKEVVKHENKYPVAVQKKDKARDRDQMEQEEAEFRKDYKNFINRESVGAIQKISPRDVMEAGKNIRNKANEIAGQVYDAFENKQGIFEAGINSVQKAFNGDKITPQERKSATQVIATVAKYAMLAAGVAVIATAAAPTAFIVARMMHESWGTLDEASGDKERRDAKKSAKQAEKEEAARLEEAARTPEEKFEDEKERLAKMLSKGKISQRAFEKAMEEAEDTFQDEREAYEENKRLRAQGKRPRKKGKRRVEEAEAGVLYDAVNDDTSDTLNNLIIGVGDFISNIDLDELKERASGTFKGIANNETNSAYMFADLRNVCINHSCAIPIQNIKNGLHGKFTEREILPWLSDIRETVYENGFNYNEEKSGVDNGVIFKRYDYMDTNDYLNFSYNGETGDFSISLKKDNENIDEDNSVSVSPPEEA